MAMNFGQIALAVAGGAAKQFVKTQEELREEYKEKKERQQQWADRYGRRTLDELQSRADVVLNAGETLENAGMTSANITQMVNEYDANSILELAKRVEKLNPRELAALKTNGQLNKVLTFEDTNAKSPEDWADVAVKSFNIPQIEPEPTDTEKPTGFLSGLRDRMGPRQEREYQDWYNSTYITGPDGEEYSIRELRAAPTGIMDRGKVPDFDLSMFEKDANQTDWNRAENDIFNIAYSSVLASDDDTLKNLLEFNADAKDRSIESREALIKTDPRLRTYFEDAVRRVYEERKRAFDTSGGRLFFYDDSLDDILISLEDQFAATGIKISDLKEFATNEEAIVFFEKDPVDWAIVAGEVVKRPYGIIATPVASEDVEPEDVEPATAQPVETGSYDEEDLTLNAQPNESVENIPTRPEPTYRNNPPRLLEQPKNKRDIKAWDKKYGNKYNPDATYKLVKPQGPEPIDRSSQEYLDWELWEYNYGETHDPRTGYPLIDNINLSLIPGTPEFEEAKQQGTPE